MKPRHLFLMLLALCALAVPAQAADTVLLTDDMEGAIDASWVVGESTNPTMIAPWQKSDSTEPKVRGNQAHGGATSYWAGPTPQGSHPADPTEGETHLTAKKSIVIPADGQTTVSFWSLFQNEGDDAGQLEAALASNPTAKGAWKKVAAVKLETSTATDPDYKPGYCNGRPEVHAQGFEELKGDFSAFAGREVLVRFNYKLGSENRQTSYPCGWYVDDLVIKTTGTPGNTATPAVVPGPGTVTPAPAKSTVKLGALKAKGKQATLKLKISGNNIERVAVALMKGKKKVATVKAAVLTTGTQAVTFRLKRKLAKGRYTLKLTATGADGSPVTATGKAKVR